MTQSPIRLACPHTWPAHRACNAWGAPGPHGCKLHPRHKGIHICACGRRDDD